MHALLLRPSKLWAKPLRLCQTFAHTRGFGSKEAVVQTCADGPQQLSTNLKRVWEQTSRGERTTWTLQKHRFGRRLLWMTPSPPPFARSDFGALLARKTGKEEEKLLGEPLSFCTKVRLRETLVIVPSRSESRNLEILCELWMPQHLFPWSPGKISWTCF